MKSYFLKFSRGMIRLLSWVLFGCHAVGFENVPKSGAVIVAANHQSYMDPPLVGAAMRREAYFFAKKELFDIFGLRWIIALLNIIPVRRGIYDPEAISRTVGVLYDGQALVMFPEGTRDNGRDFLQPKAGIGLIAQRAKAAIVPVYLYRTNRCWSSLLLRKRMKILFGTIMSAEQVSQYGDDKDSYQALAEEIMSRIARLREMVLADAKAV